MSWSERGDANLIQEKLDKYRVRWKRKKTNSPLEDDEDWDDLQPLQENGLVMEDINIANDTETSSQEATYTVEDAVEKIGFGRFQVLLYFNLGLLTVTDAFEMMLLAVLSPAVRCEWLLEEYMVALVTTVVFIGMFLGAPFYGSMADKYGRRSVVLLVSGGIGYFGFLTTFSPSYYWLLVLRCIVGFNIGGAAQGFTLLVEYLPSKYRAKLLTFHSIFWATGVCFEVLLAALVIPTWGWRWQVALSALPQIFCFVVFWFLPESARFLVAAGRRQDAINILEKAARWNRSTLPPGKLMEHKSSTRGQARDLFKGVYLRTTLQLWFSWFGAAFSYYGMVLAQSQILEQHQGCGTLETTEKYSCKCAQLQWDDYVSMIVSTFGEFLALPLNVVLIDRVGRKWTGCINMLGSGTFFVLMQICSHKWVVTIVMFLARMFATGFFNAVYIYTSEVYPTNVRSLGLGASSAMARVGSMTTPFIAQVLLASSVKAAVWVYGVICLLAAISFVTMPIETKGRALMQADH